MRKTFSSINFLNDRGIKGRGGRNNPAEEEGGQGIPRKASDPLFPPVVAFEVQ